MRENYNFSDATKNPFAGKKEKGKFNVLITYDFTEDENDEIYDDMNEVTEFPESTKKLLVTQYNK